VRSASRAASRAASRTVGTDADADNETTGDEEDKEDTGDEERDEEEEEDTSDDTEEDNEGNEDDTKEAETEDVEMKLRSASPEYQGSSRTEGGLFRGRASGIAPNMADMDMEMGDRDAVDEDLAPLMGRVHLFTTRDPTAKPYLTMKHRVTPNLEPILLQLGINYSPVKSMCSAFMCDDAHLISALDRNQRIFVEEDGMWAVRGRFDDALKNTEVLDWNTDPAQGLLLRLLADEDSALSPTRPHVSGAATATATSSRTHPAMAPRARGQKLSTEELIEELHIPKHLTDRRDADLHLAYQRWKANQSALNLLAERVSNGTWPGARPTEQQVYECFISKSTWFLYYRKNFLNITKYPNMVLWLEQDPGAPSSVDLWGFEKAAYHFKDLTEYLEHAERKGKGKKQQQPKEIAESSGTKKRKERKEKEGAEEGKVKTAEEGKVKTHKKAKTGKNKGKGRLLS
jgi:hypothetical protein